MSPSLTVAVALRVLRQLWADPRTVALLLVAPPALVTLLRFVLDGRPAQRDPEGRGRRSARPHRPTPG